MAHSFIEAHDSEMDAFENFARAQPGNVVLLIDTYDTEAAARKLSKLTGRLRSLGINIKAVRIDSGDLEKHARQVRDILDSAGLKQVTIFASGSIDEYSLAEFTKSNAPIDGFGVGSRLDTSDDAPYLDCAYKLVEYAGVARRKFSEQKATLPGPKQVYRRFDDNGFMSQDSIGVEGEVSLGKPLLQSVMIEGEHTGVEKTLDELKHYHELQMKTLPDSLKALDARDIYPVIVTEALRNRATQTDRFIENNLKAEALSG